MTATVNVTFVYRRIWLAKTWVRFCSVLSWLIGERRAVPLAVNGARRLLRVQIVSPRLFRQTLRLR